MSGPTPALAPIRPARHARFLDDGQLADLRAASLEILEEVGVHCPSASVRALYAEHGAIVDEAREVVRLPADLVGTAMARAPRGYVMGARDPAFDLVLDGTALYVATDGCGTQVREPGGNRRPSMSADVALAARLADALPAVGFYWPMLSAQDYPLTAPLHELLASYPNTVKHVQTETVMGARPARWAVEMARRPGRRRGDAAGAAAPLGPDLHDRPPGPGRRRDGRSPGPGRGRDPGGLHVDGHRRLHGPGNHPRHGRGRRRRDRGGAHPPPARPPGHARLLLADARDDGAAERRLPGNALGERDRLRGRRGAGPRLGRPDARRRLRHRRQDARLAVRRGGSGRADPVRAGRRGDRQRDGPPGVAARCSRRSSSSSTPTFTSESGARWPPSTRAARRWPWT